MRAGEAFSFERLGRHLDWVLGWPGRVVTHWRRAYIRRTCQHPSWRSWACWPWQERCERCHVVRTQEQFKHATFRFDGFKQWDKPGGYVGYGPSWKIEQQEPSKQ